MTPAAACVARNPHDLILPAGQRDQLRHQLGRHGVQVRLDHVVIVGQAGAVQQRRDPQNPTRRAVAAIVTMNASATNDSCLWSQMA